MNFPKHKILLNTTYVYIIAVHSCKKHRCAKCIHLPGKNSDPPFFVVLKNVNVVIEIHWGRKVLQMGHEIKIQTLTL